MRNKTNRHYRFHNPNQSNNLKQPQQECNTSLTNTMNNNLTGKTTCQYLEILIRDSIIQVRNIQFGALLCHRTSSTQNNIRLKHNIYTQKFYNNIAKIVNQYSYKVESEKGFLCVLFSPTFSQQPNRF